ncbi:MAG: sodium ion-translocating decarboxylase subunit beta [Smithellaceae bacterium]|jgi:carboxybiotin decarboxylase|nr:sodium ion-translocating decarboxylase subunit beta [Smithellaceae bacterium]MDD3259859.1 sodium ion-translocating decarboxylase subunit beta [Smithellaceae bacterium]MDD3849619.1 sodium ion-translocating decarboxylase subunit beta [Smithellaceae bacterium]HOQ72578.1 sodium ion-translocating decarboxylase subunit beta [Smithellaceae bacterium]HPL09559.1 sodium ion-translocating decarboxylase subunit beta [Smithellaceae bacterium]
MTWEAMANIFQGITTLTESFSHNPRMAAARIGLILLGFLMIYLGKKGYLEALLMIPMGLGMATVNAAIMFFDPLNLHGGVGTLFVEAQAGATADAVKNAAEIVTILQIDWLQPIYTFTFSNGLIACLVFMGVGVLLDVGFVMARPFQSMFIAVCAELGTIVVFPIAQWFGYTPQQAAAISIVGGADGPMVLFTSLRLAPELFVPIAIIAYLYLGFAYGGYPYLIRLLVPKKLLGIKPAPAKKKRSITSGEKMLFAVVACVFLSFLLPVAAPLIFSLFFGVVIRESGIKEFIDLLQGPILYGSTMFLGLMLGVLCDANTIMDPKVLPLLLLGILALLISGIGGILAGYVLYFMTRGKFNPAIGIAGVSCVPTTAKVAQKVVSKVNRGAIILPDALGANVSGVITTAIIAGIFCSLLAK